MAFLAIVGVSIAAAVLYGIAHDQVTARLSMEYFSIGHPTIPGLDYSNPTLVALVWGTIATWWVGLALGILLAIAARAGSRPPVGVGSVLRPIGWLLVAMAGCSVLGGLAAHGLAVAGAIWLVPPFAEQVQDPIMFLAVGGAHLAAYAAGGIGGLIIAVRVWRSRAVHATANPERPAA